ncbi:TrkH family potassium uptake protein [Histidinibacterium aquaticum]|uniref:Ktr system potassium transporter B n=1 Tax=Histidinibacterium aquaticum TaxID=2613962 RepID=A0A5J5GQZ0_9RHOB|nr:TrkH family potassium uptake protein [Histidinibacterium aquaticum]KAA9010495.1 Ktr system potassium transporter B [Histidinibacterium aquaticum]
MRVSFRGRVLWLPPPALLALLYFVLILAGTALLMLPAAQAQPVGLGDALFMSASAVTVTGLVVVDPGTSFTLFGQAVLMGLIQLGGLGLMVFAALLLLSLGIGIGLPQRVVLSEELGQGSMRTLRRLAKLIVTVAVVAELLGASILAVAFVPVYGWGEGLWQALFHAVSAFNNAGFSLFPDSLMSWAGRPLVCLTIAALFIAGGLGFVVLNDLWQKRRWRTLSLHSKLMLAGTAALLLLSWGLVAALEWRNPGTLGAIDGTGARLLAAFFEGATPRTAGFNSLDTAAMEDATTVLVMGLMFVGGGPTSTAGGIKVTTAIVLVLATYAFFRRRESMHAFGRSLGIEEVLKVMALTTISVATVFVGLFVLAAVHEGPLFDLFFEVVSAFGTVGLSRGATGDLDLFGQIVIGGIMFLGRVGPLTLGFFLATRSHPRVGYPRGEVYLG